MKYSPHSSHGRLEEQDKIIPHTTLTMALPEKSARPLKKRRIVSIEPDATSQQPITDSSRSKPRNKKAKRTRTAVSPLPSPPTSPPKTVIKKSVTWNDPDGNVVHVQPDPTKLHPFFNESDVWYTKNNYQDFLLDRLQTIESHRFLTANKMSNDDGNYSGHCIRGLEIFQEKNSNEHFQSKKKLYHSTIHMEQMRQAMLGINDPERFRTLVASQSDLALHRAQELAAQDAREAYSFNGSSGANHKPSINATTSSPHSTNNGTESGGASIVSDNSSTGSTDSSSNSNNSGGQSVFADEAIRKLQERSMRRLMGIYQNNNGEGSEGSGETHALFKFARKDSLMGIRNKKLAATATANASFKNSSWAVPSAEKRAPSPPVQGLELLHRRQVLQPQQKPVSSNETALLEEQIAGMLRQREILQEHIRQQKELQQRAASVMNSTPSLQEQLMEMMERRKVLQDYGQQFQTASSDVGTYNDSGRVSTTNATSSLIEKYFIQQQQRHRDHKNKMKLALMAMNANRFPIRRDTLSHVPTKPNQNNSASMSHKPTLPWSLSGMA